VRVELAVIAAAVLIGAVLLLSFTRAFQQSASTLTLSAFSWSGIAVAVLFRRYHASVNPLLIGIASAAAFVVFSAAKTFLNDKYRTYRQTPSRTARPTAHL
jgi:hypothetical protein